MMMIWIYYVNILTFTANLKERHKLKNTICIYFQDPVEDSDEDTVTNKPKENFIKKVIKNITIEPAMFVISLAVMLDGVSYGQMVLEKSCKVDFGFNDTVCDNLVHDFKEENELVQNEVRYNTYVLFK